MITPNKKQNWERGTGASHLGRNKNMRKKTLASHSQQNENGTPEKG